MAQGERFQILALDGGGLKGLFAAAVLAELEKDLGTSLRTHFDLVVGTSTGGLIALGLGADVAPASLVDFYLRMGPEIFPDSWLRRVGRLFRSKYRNKALRDSLESVFGARRLGDSVTRLVIPAYSLDANDVYIFKTPHHTDLRRDYRVLMVDVGMATTAAPTFLPAVRVGNERMIDGGIWANNPSLVGVAEAVSKLDIPLSRIHVLSLGTTDPLSWNAAELDQGGILRWAIPSRRLILEASARGTFHAAQHLVGKDHIVRVDTTVPDGLFKMDGLDPVAIRALAEDVSRRLSPQVAPFTRHIPKAFVPAYRPPT